MKHSEMVDLPISGIRVRVALVSLCALFLSLVSRESSRSLRTMTQMRIMKIIPFNVIAAEMGTSITFSSRSLLKNVFLTFLIDELACK